MGAPQLTGWFVMRVGKRHVPRKKKCPWSVAQKEQSYDLRVTECPGIKRSLGPITEKATVTSNQSRDWSNISCPLFAKLPQYSFGDNC